MDERERRSARIPWGALLGTATMGGLLGAAGAGVWLSGHPVTPSRSSPADPVAPRGVLTSGPEDGGAVGIEALRSELDELRERLRAEAAARRQLARRLGQLRDARSADGTTPVGAPEGPADDAKPAQAASEVPPFFDHTALVAIGVSETDVAWLHELHDSFEMKQLELMDQATREGWLGTPRFVQEHGEQLASLRDELGEEVYDLVLYAAGEKNRVIVGDVLQSSPAERSGIETSDVILSYDGRRIFNGAELRGATAEGERGESVAVGILRDDRPRQILVPRGPLGVRVHAARQPPFREP